MSQLCTLKVSKAHAAVHKKCCVMQLHIWYLLSVIFLFIIYADESLQVGVYDHFSTSVPLALPQTPHLPLTYPQLENGVRVTGIVN